MRHRRSIGAALVIAALVPLAMIAVACGGGSSDGNTAADTPAPAAVAPTASATGATVRTVEGQGDPRTDWKFDPAQVTVRVGDTVTFTDAGSEAHTATADDGSFDTGTLNPGDTKPVKFDRAGSFGFHCSLHPWMTGTVVVTASAASSYNG